MQPNISLLTDELVNKILDEAFQLLVNPGIKVQSPSALQLLEVAGARIDREAEVVHIPENIVRQALETVPHEFHLYDRYGIPKITYGGNAVHFDPGSSGVHILDSESNEHRPSYPNDLIRIVQRTEFFPH